MLVFLRNLAKVGVGGVRFIDFAEKIISAKIVEESTLKQYWRIHNNMFKPLFKDQYIREISHSDILEFYKYIGENHGKCIANRALTLLSSIFSKACKDNIATHNPCHGVERHKEIPRARYLETEEIPDLHLAVEKVPAYYRNYFMLLLYTGQRGQNVKSMEWKEINWNTKMWRIPAQKAKNKKGGVFPLSNEAIAHLQEMKAISGNSQFVFPSKRSRSGHLEEPKKRWYKVCGIGKLLDLHMHDLRATFATCQEEAGTSKETIQITLGHSNVKTTEIYLRAKQRRNKDAADSVNKVGAFIASLKPQTSKT